jgi:hypothetical protein
MHHRKPLRAETPIERIYREETGRQMPRQAACVNSLRVRVFHSRLNLWKME